MLNSVPSLRIFSGSERTVRHSKIEIVLTQWLQWGIVGNERKLDLGNQKVNEGEKLKNLSAMRIVTLIAS